MITIVHKINPDNVFLGYDMKIIHRPFWISEGAGRVRYWNKWERFGGDMNDDFNKVSRQVRQMLSQ